MAILLIKEQKDYKEWASRDTRDAVIGGLSSIHIVEGQNLHLHINSCTASQDSSFWKISRLLVLELDR